MPPSRISRAMRLLALASLSVLAGCATVPPPAPVPAPPRPVPQPPAPAPAPVPAPPPPSSDWRDWPAAAGNWTYRSDARGSVASFGLRTDAPEFTLRCDGATRQIRLSRRGVTAGAITLRTSTTLRALTARAEGGEMVVTLAATDPILDAMGYSRGRFVVEMPPLAPLVVPTWAEVQRVVEDCRR